MDQSTVNLASTIRALVEVVAPAVDPHNARAREQLNLSVDHLSFLLERIDHLHERHYFELRHRFELASTLLAETKDEQFGAREALRRVLEDCIDQIGASEEQAQTGMALAMPIPIATLRHCLAEMSVAIADMVRAGQTLSSDARDRIERCVLAQSGASIAFERVWYVPLGFDAHARDMGTLMDVFPERRGGGIAAR